VNQSEFVQVLRQLEERLLRVATLDPDQLEAEHIGILGRSAGALNKILKTLPSLEPTERRVIGGAANQLKARFEAAFAERREQLRLEVSARESAGADLTMAGRARWIGAEHPVTTVVQEIVGVFRRLGFAVALGPEAETEWYNFGALNFPADHPAMDMHDTLYLDVEDRRVPGQDRRRGRSSGVESIYERRSESDRRAGRPEGRLLMRTHTSPVQIRTLLAHRPPVRVVMPGLCYRKDTFDPSHAPVFSQIEGLVVDAGVSFVDFKGTLLHFAREFFSASTKVRFRPSYFPFTEPSAEMDVACQICGGSGCGACKGTGWMEIMGCGMVHPVVLENCEVDSEINTGFAFGMGPHRIAMLRYGIPDIRLLYQSDMRFLGQFGLGGPAGRRAGGQEVS
jgi:phenylalanyl-tRNA synthetase alpha chain